MSLSFAENDLKNISDTILELIKFLNSVRVEDVDTDTIESVFKSAHYVEEFVKGLRSRQMIDLFDEKLNAYLSSKGTNVKISISDYEMVTDIILRNTMRLMPRNEILMCCIKKYIEYGSIERFSEAVSRLQEFRQLFLRLSFLTKDVCPHTDVLSSFLVQSWIRLLNDGDEVSLLEIVTDIFNVDTNDNILIGVLNLERMDSVGRIQQLVANVILSLVKKEPFSRCWLRILSSPQLNQLINRYPEILEATMVTLSELETYCKYEENTNIWLETSPEFSYMFFLNILKGVYNDKSTHFKIKRLIRVKLHKSHRETWKQIEKDLTPDPNRN